MPSELFTAAAMTVVDLLTTYLLHSTLLLATTSLAVGCCRSGSPALVERLWKSAAVIPLMTAPLQLLCGFGIPVFAPCWSGPATLQIAKRAEPPDVQNTEGVDGGQSRSGSGHVDPAPVTPDIVPDRRIASAGPSEPLPIADTAEDEIVSMLPSADVITPGPHRNPVAASVTSSSRAAELNTLPAAAPRSPTGQATWLAGLTLSIVILGSLRLLATGRRFRKKIQTFRPVESGVVVDVLTRLGRRTSLRRRVRVLEAPHLSEPIAFGTWRWTIVVPRGIESRLDGRELQALLAHELAHLVRGDTWWLLIGRLLCGCLPFQPLNFLARLRWRQAAEIQCDDWAAERSGNRLTLASCLTRVAEWRLDTTSAAHALSAGGSRSLLSYRVERLLAGPPAADPWSRPRRRRLLAILALSVTAMLCWHGPRSMLPAQLHEQRGVLSPAGAETLGTDALSGEIESLDAELRQLETDLRQVALLLQTSDPSPEVRTLAAGLTPRLAALQQRRRELSARVGRQSAKPEPTLNTAGAANLRPKLFPLVFLGTAEEQQENHSESSDTPSP